MQNKVIIAIPIYKNQITEDEKLSLECCLSVLKNYDIAFVCPENLDITAYENICREYDKTCSYEKFSDDYFTDRNAYSRLCLSTEFYERFSNYEYMLIYQLDCWVFRDELLSWCEKGYDYIGAPWPENRLKEQGLVNIKHGGNGGLSLRKISSMINLTKTDIKNRKARCRTLLRKIVFEKKKSFISRCLHIPKYLYIWFYKNYIHNGIENNEDMIIVQYAKEYIADFKFADIKTCSQFAFEIEPENFYKQNDNQLPFGCHDYKKRWGFWEEFIGKESAL